MPVKYSNILAWFHFLALLYKSTLGIGTDRYVTFISIIRVIYILPELASVKKSKIQTFKSKDDKTLSMK